jgi:hypothetical protein
MNEPAAADGGKIVYSVESRKSLEISLADVTVDGRLEILPHVENSLRLT